MPPLPGLIFPVTVVVLMSLFMFTRAEAMSLDMKDAAPVAIEQLKARRAEIRKRVHEALEKGNHRVATRSYKDLLALTEPQLRDCRDAARFFEEQQDWASLATAWEIMAESMWQASHKKPDAFIRPAPEDRDSQLWRGGQYVLVQTNLDGEWIKGRGDSETWIPWIERKQKELKLKRITLLENLGELCLKRLITPHRAVAAYKAAGRGVPLFTKSLEKLIPKIWPKVKVSVAEILAMDHPGAEHIRLKVLDGLAEAQTIDGDIHSAVETRLRAMLVMLISAGGDWNALGPMRETDAFWHLVKQLPPDAPLPPTLWLGVLDPNRPELIFSKPEDGPHGLPRSYPGPNIVAPPGYRIQTLTVSAYMEGSSGHIRCLTYVDGKVFDLDYVNSSRDPGKDGEWRTSTFEVPEDTGIIRLRITPAVGSDFHVRTIKVKAGFPSQPMTQTAMAPRTGHDTIVSPHDVESTPVGRVNDSIKVHLRAERIVWSEGENPAFRADIQNHGNYTMRIWKSPMRNWEVEVDGQWYQPGVAEYSWYVPLLPGQKVEGIQIHLLPVRISYPLWVKKGTNERAQLELKPGKHTIRVAVIPWRKGWPSVSVVSNAVEIEIKEKERERD